ncbi:metallophosphoesterase [Rhodococcus sp. BP22]|uniref:metallophosphoesterase family protein n=1 Tax=Rhodococcus sp. BP22 TaxID=2758566 RepID=UPI0016451026|nr:metallophosphoesterase family protein [Rhodococcus sp. BP22]
MRIALISDVHGNIAALDAVLTHISRQHVDSIANLGDIVSGGLHPRRTADRLMNAAIPTIAGNHERQLLSTDRARMSASDGHAFDQLTDSHHDWLRSLPPSLDLGAGVLAIHGTPANDLEYFLETVEPGGCRPATAAEVEHRASRCSGWAVIACGHTHLQRKVWLSSGTLVVNPGSVGMPAYADDHPYPHVMESGTHHARYAVIEDNAENRWATTFHKVDYDATTAAVEAGVNGREDIAAALLSGRVATY